MHSYFKGFLPTDIPRNTSFPAPRPVEFFADVPEEFSQWALTVRIPFAIPSAIKQDPGVLCIPIVPYRFDGC